MTWSILARDAEGRLGAAIASRFFAVGSLCLASSSAGIVCTQALINPLYGPDGLGLLADGIAAGDAVARLIAHDAGREQRQLHLLPRAGAAAAFTGASCIDWFGHLVQEDLSIAGNMLAGPGVIEETARAFRATARLPLAERLLAAMEAGEAAGGDKRGKQGAALRIQHREAYPVLDLRVDDHPEALSELRRLYDKSLERYQAYVQCLATRADYAGLTDRAAIDARVARFQAERKGGSGSSATG